MEESSTETILHRTACSECQRRKQKCNREWPCNHCQRRKVADKCRFNVPAPDQGDTRGSVENKKRHADGGLVQPPETSELEGPVENLGYMAAEMLARLGITDQNDDTGDGQYWTCAATCATLDRVFSQLPKRSWVDLLVQTFLNHSNYHFYILYSPSFREEYQSWWDRISENRSVGLQWTCLLLTVCACAVQHADSSLKERIEADMGSSIDIIAAKYHNLAQELGSVIPPGYCHLYRCQWLLHSVYWFISQGKYMESWHVLSAAAREGKELGLTRDIATGLLPEFDREMRRRVWCIIQVLDWQISAGLSRSTIVSWPDVEVVFPSLTMDGSGPSPILHMRLQSEVITDLAVEYPKPGAIITVEDIRHYHGIVFKWSRSFPSIYALDNPDTSHDDAHSWLGFNRYYLHTIFYFLMLAPIRPYMAKEYVHDSLKEELDIRTDGIEYCLKNLRSDAKWTKHISCHGGGYHFMIFSLLDTVALLSATVLKDTQKTISNLYEIFEEVNNAVRLISGIRQSSTTAAMGYHALSTVAGLFPQPDISDQQQKRQKLDNTPNLPASAGPSGGTAEPSKLCGSCESSPECLDNIMTPINTPNSSENVETDCSTSGNSPETGIQAMDIPSIDACVIEATNQTESQSMTDISTNQRQGLKDTLVEPIDEFTALWEWANLDWDVHTPP